MCAKQILEAGAGKLHVKNRKKKWLGWKGNP